MDLLLFPCAVASSTAGDRPAITPGLAHGDDQPCPFADRIGPFGRFGSCCVFDTTALVHAVDVFHGDYLAARVHQDMSHPQVVLLGEELKYVLDELEDQLAIDIQDGASGQCRLLGIARGSILVWDEPLSLAEAIEEVKRGIFWFETIAERGFGASAWPTKDSMS